MTEDAVIIEMKVIAWSREWNKVAFASNGFKTSDTAIDRLKLISTV